MGMIFSTMTRSLPTFLTISVRMLIVVTTLIVLAADCCTTPDVAGAPACSAPHAISSRAIRSQRAHPSGGLIRRVCLWFGLSRLFIIVSIMESPYSIMRHMIDISCYGVDAHYDIRPVVLRL